MKSMKSEVRWWSASFSCEKFEMILLMGSSEPWFSSLLVPNCFVLKSGLITFIGLFQERLKKEQEEKEHKKKEKAEAHLYTIIKVSAFNF